MLTSDAFVGWFREASPYIHAHRGHTFVLCFGGEAVVDSEPGHLLHDIALLNALGVRLIVVHGARPQIEARLLEQGVASKFVDGLRVTDQSALNVVRAAVATLRIEIEAVLSEGLPSSPMAGARIRVASGNFVTARPLGIRNGVDFGHTGLVRRVDSDAIRAQLAADALVLVSPLGYSPSGEVFNLHANEVATVIASELKAAKLVFLSEQEMPRDSQGNEIRQVTQAALQQLLDTHSGAMSGELACAVQACRDGVKRVHIIPRAVDGGLLLELFSRDGVGTLVSATPFDAIRQATVEDISGIFALLRPLQEDGSVKKRTREELQDDIEHFTVIVRDGTVIACAALHIFPGGNAEIASLAVHADYRKAGQGDSLLEYLHKRAAQADVDTLFVLTTQAEHWFRERGFREETLAALPSEKRELYNYKRNSKVFVKDI